MNSAQDSAQHPAHPLPPLPTPPRPLALLYASPVLTEEKPLPLPLALAQLYGPLSFPAPTDQPTQPTQPSLPARPHVFGNFVETLDGVAALGGPGLSGGGEISGFNAHDRMLMGLLRAVADAVVVGAGTLRADPTHRWTASHIFPALAAAYQELRADLGKPTPPLNVIVTASGDLDTSLPVFQSGEVSVLIVTTPAGATRLDRAALPSAVVVAATADTGRIHARDILSAIARVRPAERILVEGGPSLMGDFLGEQCLDELFLTLAPQVAGQDGVGDALGRPGFVAGRRFAPEHPLWGDLRSVHLGGSHLFLRYGFYGFARGRADASPRGPQDAAGDS